MKLSTRSEYACLALIDLAQHRDEGFVSTPLIAERQGVPRQYLEQILLILKRAGYVRSRRGTGGGYRLARDPASISMAEVIRLLDGALAPVESVSRYFYEPTPIEKEAKLLEAFRVPTCPALIEPTSQAGPGGEEHCFELGVLQEKGTVGSAVPKTGQLEVPGRLLREPGVGLQEFSLLKIRFSRDPFPAGKLL